jgi:hypothetical protein
MSNQDVPLFPPYWFVHNLNEGVARDWAGDGPAPVRTALDPLVMFAWHTATAGLREPQPLLASCLLSGV